MPHNDKHIQQAAMRDSFNSKYRGGMGSTNQAQNMGINVNQARNAGMSIPDLNQQVMKMNATDYGRPMNVSGFNDKLALYNQFQNRGDQVIKDSQGRSILGMQMPNLTMQQPTGSQVMGDIRRRLGQDAQNYGGGVMSMLANAVLPGAGTLMNLYQGARNGMQNGKDMMQGGMQNLIDYRPQMNQPRDGMMGGIDRLFNLGKGMMGGTPYQPQREEDLGATNYGLNPMMINNAPQNTYMARLTDEQKMLLNKRRGNYDMGIFGIQEMLDQLPDGDPNDPATYQDVETYLT
tara:strand:+ start:1571 stop:2440 length:870 start_codon:yes stop_codon:yes gene_type:complete